MAMLIGDSADKLLPASRDQRGRVGSDGEMDLGERIERVEGFSYH